MNVRLRALALVTATCLAATAVPAADDGKSTSPAAIEIVMPATGAFIPSGPVIIAGRLPPGAEAMELRLDGALLTAVTRSGATFSATLAPRPGPHTLEARAGDLTTVVTFASGTGGRGTAPYRYHAPVLEGRCAECHTGMRRQTPRAEADTCIACHRKLAVIFPYIHGPVAAGKCLVCHDPHGSNRPALATADSKELCTRCHDQPSSLEHIDKARSRVCHLCHNPHASMNRRFLYDIVK